MFQHGVVAIYKKSECPLMYKKIDLKGFALENTLECCGIIANKCFVFICIYRAPSGDFKLFLKLPRDLLSYVNKFENGNAIIGGEPNIDFNADRILQPHRKNSSNNESNCGHFIMN